MSLVGERFIPRVSAKSSAIDTYPSHVRETPERAARDRAAFLCFPFATACSVARGGAINRDTRPR
jgi:hypothetical protein